MQDCTKRGMQGGTKGEGWGKVERHAYSVYTTGGIKLAMRMQRQTIYEHGVAERLKRNKIRIAGTRNGGEI